MLSLKPLYQLPVDSSRFGHADYCDEILYYDFVRAGVRIRGRIRFERVPAYRFRAERCMQLWQYEAGDMLVEVEDSEWVREIRADTDRVTRDGEVMHHYAVYLESIGAWEIIAESWEALPEQEGSWPRISPK
jgi:hypothetical protein